ELPQERDPLALTTRDLVQVLLHLRGEVGLDEVPEVVAQQLRDRERREAGHERLSLTEHVAATHDGRNRRRERRWPADAETFQLLDERRFGEPRRRRRLVPLRLHVAEGDRRRAVAVNAVADLRLREDRF